MLYDIIHYKWVDQQMQNLRSNAIFYSSAIMGDSDGPLVYLDHGGLCWFGNAGNLYSDQMEHQAELLFQGVLINGEPIGPALSKYSWLFSRDYTTEDPYSMYNFYSLQTTPIPCFYGDPNLHIYNPGWSSPVPVDA